MMRFLAVAALVAALPVAALAQQYEISKNSITGTATITRIDAKTRSITLRAANGEEETFTASPQVERFDQLKAGDKINATYYESWVVEVRKGGPAQAAAAVTGERLAHAPGGMVLAVQTASVTVKAIDPKVPSITVTTPDGRTVTRKIADAKKLAGVAVGDHLDIAFTQSLMVHVEAAK